MGSSAAQLLTHLGYAGLAAGLVLSTMGLFSSELLLLVGGWAVRQGQLNLIAVLIVAVMAQLVGVAISYSLGRYGGVPLIESYGRYVLLSHKDLERAHRWFGRYGRWAAGLGYCLPLLRGYIGYAAGIAQQPVRGFSVSAAIGSTIWTALLITLGYVLAAHLTAAEQILKPFSYALLAVVVVLIAGFFWHRWREVRG